MNKVILSFILFFLTAFAAWAGMEEKPYPESHFSTIDGIRLHYRLWEVPETKQKGNEYFVEEFI